MLKTDRKLVKFILLSIITLGIYAIVVIYCIGRDLNTIASTHDNRTSMNYVGVILLGLITFGIVPLVWYHRVSNRVGNELKRRGFDYPFNFETFWLWGVLGALIIVGPYIYVYKLLTAMNMLSEDYNKNL